MNLTPLRLSILAATLCHTPQGSANPSIALNQSAMPSLTEADQIQPGNIPKLMLAKWYKADIELQQYWISEKLDGIRAYWNGQQLISRQGYPIYAPLWFTQALPATPLDGELWSGRGQFEATSAAIRRYQPLEQEWRRIQYLVFDLPSSTLPFQQRIPLLQQLIQQLDARHIETLGYFQASSHAELLMLLQQRVDSGAEGLMLNRLDADYQGQRSDALLKLKTHQDGEAMVLAHLPGKGKYTGMLGAIRVELESGQRFNIGSGFTDQQRQNPPPIGAIVSFKHFGLTATGKPRFASFKRLYENEQPSR